MANKQDKARPLAAVIGAFADAAGELLAHPECPSFLHNQLETMKAEAFMSAQNNPETMAEAIAANRQMFRVFLPWCR